ncbi:hypothetical protein LTR56_028261, partial [Elasticomyces elasticus]
FLVVLTITLIKSRQSSVTVNKCFIGALVFATLMVYLRTCFRLTDTAKGLMNSLSTHEVYFGCLEFAPIVLAVYTLIWYHPGKWLPNASQHKSGRRFDRSADGFGKEGGA